MLRELVAVDAADGARRPCFGDSNASAAGGAGTAAAASLAAEAAALAADIQNGIRRFGVVTRVTEAPTRRRTYWYHLPAVVRA